MKKIITRLAQLRAPLLNGLLVILLAVLFVQCGVFMAMYAGVRRSSADVPFDMRMLSASSSDALRELNPKLLAPESIAIHDGTSCHAVLHSAVVVEELYTEMSHCLFPALLAEPMEAAKEEWDAALKNTYVYARYANELPYQVICAFAASLADSDAQVRRTEPYVGVREILLIADENGNFVWLLVRGTGGIFRFALAAENNASVFTAYPLTYSESFCKAELVDRGDMCILKTEDSLPSRVIHTSSGVTTLLTTNQDILRFLNFNPDKLNYHVEPDGTYIYVESHGILRAGTEEMLYHATESGGIEIDGIGGGSAADIYAYLRVASYLINRLGTMSYQYIGGDAGLYLESVSADGETVTLSFKFRCDNIVLAGGEESQGMTLRFTGNRLTEIRYRMMIIRRTLEENRIMLQSWYRRMLGGDETADMRLIYSTEGNSYTLTAAWAVIASADTEEGGDPAWVEQD